MEVLAGDAAAAEAILGRAVESLDPVENAAWFASMTRFGQWRSSSSTGSTRRCARRGRPGDSPDDDLLAQITWRQAIASAYVRYGAWTEAEPSRSRASSWPGRRRLSCSLAESLLALAEVRDAGGERAAAASLVEEALALLRAKGNVARIQQLGPYGRPP